MTMIGRRHLIATAGLLGVATLASGASARRRARAFFAAHDLPLGVQLYAVAPDLEADFDGTLRRLYAMGIRTVETAGFHGRTPAQLRASLDRVGLRCTSAHIPFKPYGAGDLGLDGDLDVLARDMHMIGITHVVLPGPRLETAPTSRESFAAALAALSKDDWRRTADMLNTTGKALSRHGLAISYHNHNVEFAPHPWGTAMDLLLRDTDPAIVTFEMDAGWVAAAGLNPVDLLRAHPQRFTQMHVKDIEASTRPNFDVRQDPIEVGSGKMDWPAILPAAYAAGVRGFFVEQEPPFSGPRLTSIAKSAAYLLALETER